MLEDAAAGSGGTATGAPVDALLIGGSKHHKRAAEGLERLEVLVLSDEVRVERLQVVGLQGVGECHGWVAAAAGA